MAARPRLKLQLPAQSLTGSPGTLIWGSFSHIYETCGALSVTTVIYSERFQVVGLYGSVTLGSVTVVTQLSHRRDTTVTVNSHTGKSLTAVWAYDLEPRGVCDSCDSTFSPTRYECDSQQSHDKSDTAVLAYDLELHLIWSCCSVLHLVLLQCVASRLVLLSVMT